MSRHVAHFYDGAFPTEQVAEYYSDALRAGEICVSLLREPHRDAVEQSLEDRGIDLRQADYVAIDTDRLLSHLMTGGRLDMALANAMMTPVMTPPSAGPGRRVKAVGDLAPTLLEAGHVHDAMAFEKMLHQLTEAHGGTTVCPYSIRRLSGRGALDSIVHVCTEHATLEWPRHDGGRPLDQRRRQAQPGPGSPLDARPPNGGRPKW